MQSDALRRVIAQGVEALLERQRADGAFDFCCEVNPLPDAMMALCLRLMGTLAHHPAQTNPGAQADAATSSVRTPGHAPVDPLVHAPAHLFVHSSLQPLVHAPVDPLADALCRRIESLQDEDGSWRGRWGICFLYGTWAAVSGLAAAGVPRKDPVMRRAAAWLCRVQHADGGIRGVMPPFLW